MKQLAMTSTTFLAVTNVKGQDKLGLVQLSYWKSVSSLAVVYLLEVDLDVLP